ncbi:tandem-95 repeat protein [Candidatus Accumulibacter sp. ACC003]|uniref:tandem-95 repeat protein n=1 Tax=Candidatus Accumulibacter sp. ACC003 TaxID=2823334 RepID=UPI0025C14373|nr:tandem-95 repeat protein [Candidatus Accumulibacter sp. ACC003]
MRVVADAAANAPKIVVSTTPSTPLLPGQSVLASVRADAWSGIARIAVELRDGQDGDWQSLALDAAGRVKLLATRPGLLELRVTATDRDGFVATRLHTLRVKDSTDNSAPQLAWSGALAGSNAASQPRTLRASTAIAAQLYEAQLLGWQLQISAAGSDAWQTLAEADVPASAVAQTLALADVDPRRFDNGTYQLRLSAWDLAGRRSEIASTIIIDSADKTFASALQIDATLTLAGHTLALARQWHDTGSGQQNGSTVADFGNWTLPLLASHLASDQPATLDNGATAPWSDGARVWLSVAADIGDASAGLKYLSFTLHAASERLGQEAAAPLLWHPQFAADQGWTLQAYADADRASLSNDPAPAAADNLQRQGDRLYEQLSGLPWVPTAYTLTSPDGSRYTLDAQGTINSVRFADGRMCVVSDAGIAAVGGDVSERIDFQRDSAGRILRITFPIGPGGNDASTLSYRYDSAGRLIVVRRLDDADLGTPIAYDAAGQPLSDALTANLGAIASWNEGSDGGGGGGATWSGTLSADASVNIAFTVRASELASTAHTPGSPGAVIIALETTLPLDGELEVVGAQLIGTASVHGRVTRLLRVGEAGVKLIRLRGVGDAELRLSVAGDVNHDGVVDGIDSQAWQEAEAAHDANNTLADLDGDGAIDSHDRQLLYANSGFRANQAPVATDSRAPITTHAGLASRRALSGIAEDREGDPIFWRILGSTHGDARLAADGQTLLFRPADGYSGEANVTLQADDGFTAGAAIELTIRVSAASLLQLQLALLPTLASGQFTKLHATADFADELGVVITDDAYLTLSAADLGTLGATAPMPLRIDDSRDLVHATGSGPALLIVQRVHADGRLIQAVAATNVRAAPLPFDVAADDESDYSNYADEEAATIEPDVYPGTLTLTPGDSRQLKVHVLDAYSDQPIDIHNARQTVFAGTPEALETYTDPDTGEDFEVLIPAAPAVYSGTRYFVSDASVATVSADGLISALRAGEVTLSIVHLASVVDDYGELSQQAIGQTNIRLSVQAAQFTDDDPLTATPAGIQIAADQGGVVQAASGETVMIGAGALPADALVSIRRIELANIEAATGLAAPAPAIVQALAAFHLEIGEENSTLPVQLAITLQDDAGVQVGDEVLFLRRGTAPDVNGQLHDIWWLVDNGFVGTNADGQLVARTASPPYSGISASGDLLCVKSAINSQTGAVTVRGSAINVFALMMDSLAISMSGGLAGNGLSGASAASGLIGSLAGLSDVFAICVDSGGVYQVVPVQKTIADGDLTLTIESANGASPNADDASSPRISAVQVLSSGKLRLTLEQLQPNTAAGMPAQPVALRVWISPDRLTVDPLGKASSESWKDEQGARHDGLRVWQKLLDLEAVAAGASSATLDLDLPKNIALGVHTLTVQRLLQTLDPAVPGAMRWLADGDAARVTIEGQSVFSVVTQDHVIRIFRGGAVVKEIEYPSRDGRAGVVNGSKTDQIAFSLDNRLMYVAGMGGDIHVIDTATMQLAATFSVGTANVSSLAVSGQSLYVAEGGYYDARGAYRLLRVNIDETASNFLAIEQIDLPAAVSGQNAPYGYIDLAVSHGVHSYLAVTASQRDLGVSAERAQPDGGKVFIVDLDRLLEKHGRLAVSGADAFVLVDIPTPQGQGPQFISSAGIKGNALRLLLSNALDRNAGLATVSVGLSDSGALDGTTTFRQLVLSAMLPGLSHLDASYQLNIQRAQSPALVVSRNGIDYALVADYFFDFVDPLYALDDPQNGVRQMGGKIGVVKDPFGASPEYLGATSPIIDANISRLQVSDAGQTLWADIRYWPTIGEPPSASGLLVWDLEQLLAAAERNSLARHASPRPLPIDRERIDGVTTQVVTPSKFDLASSQKLTSGWIFGIAASALLKPDAVEFTAPVDGGLFLKTGIEPDADHKVPELNYGDIARVDLFKLIRDQYASTLANVKDADLGVTWDNIEVSGAAQVVKDATGFLLTAERQDGFASVAAATEKTYKGLQAVNTDQGKKTLRNSGVIFLAPIVDVDQLRMGKNLPSGDITITLKGFDQDDPEKRLLLKLRVVDYQKAPETVLFGDRPLNNPGYHAFEPAGPVNAAKDGQNSLLDVWRTEQRLKYLGFGLSPINQKGEITVNGSIDDAERIALRQFAQIVEGETDYKDTVTKEVKVKGKMKPVTERLPPVILSPDDLAWLSAYNAPHWLNFFPSGRQQLVGWVDKTDQKKPTEAMGTSWVFDLMLAAQATATAQARPHSLWFNGTGSLGAMLNLGINEEYVSKPNRTRVDDRDIVTGLTTNIPPSVIASAGKSAYQNKIWDYNNALALSNLLRNPNLNNYNAVTKTAGTVLANARGDNRQDQALRDFFAVYSSTLADDVAANGSWEEIGTSVQSGTSAAEKKRIQYALFGNGTQDKGLIAAADVRLGGLGLNIGAKLDQAALGKGTISGIAPALIEYAWNEFSINTPQRIAAFLAQSKQETSFTTLREDLRHRNATRVSRLFTASFTYSAAEGAVNDKYREKGRNADENAKAYIDDNLPAAGSSQDAWINYEKAFANRVYSTDYGNGASGYTRDSKKIWDYIGRGLIQLTGSDVYDGFIEFLENKPKIDLPSSTSVAKNHELIASNIGVAAYSAGWYWNKRNINNKADSVGLFGAYSEAKYLEVTKAVNGAGQAGAKDRWKYFNEFSNKAYAEGNPYESMRSALDRLGLVASNARGYEDYIGIILNKRTLTQIENGSARRLVAPDDLKSNLPSEPIINRTRFFEQSTTTLSDHEGGSKMIYLPPVDLAFSIYADAQAVQQRHAGSTNFQGDDEADIRATYGLCRFMPSTRAAWDHARHGSVFYELDISTAASDIGLFDHPSRPDLNIYKNAFAVVKSPKHGKLVEYKAHKTINDLRYEPDRNYVGVDEVTVVVTGVDQRTKDSVELELRYHLKVTRESYEDYLTLGEKIGRKYCPKLYWPISVVESSAASQRNSAETIVRFTDLPSAAVGYTAVESQNATITLSPTAAGYGWFIDLTPTDNAEFLPTSDPLEWIARPGSEADGRMDMLTVLLHEYGHVVGLEHSANSHDLMASTLLPGVRRLPSAGEAAALGGLLLGTGSVPLPYDPSTPPGAPLPLSRSLASVRSSRLRQSDPTPWRSDDERSGVAQFDIAANLTLENASFSDGSGWSTTGDVRFAQGSATLKESAATQTRLNQAFVVGAHDRLLSFTLSGIALDDTNAAPDDAFEVALIDANSGLSLFASTGLAGSDAILNMQADGRAYLADDVTMTSHPDGSRSIVVDLAGIAAGTVVNLVFDLIGFGRGAAASSSQVTITQLQLASTVLEAHDDNASTAEDTALTLDVVSNDVGADRPGVWPVVVDGPAHGELTVDADGRFSYRPHANWYGDDRFTYRLRGDGVESAVATVSVTVTPVNDAPTIVARSVALDEDSEVVLDLLADASDVDGDALQFVTESPQHGTLSGWADGTISYRPAPDFNGQDSFVWRVSDGELSTESVLRITVKAVNDAPVAADDDATLAEDDRIVLDLLANDDDVDGDALSVLVVSPAAHGTLTRDDEQRLIYTPDANWSGEDTFTYLADDGQARSAVATVRLVVTPLADAPKLSVAEAAAREVFRTGWESIGNAWPGATFVKAGELEGWRLLGEPSASAASGIKAWHTGNLIADATGRPRAIAAAPGNGFYWLQLTYAGGSRYPTQAIERKLETVAGARYTLSFDLAGVPGYGAEQARVGIMVDGQPIASVASPSPIEGLAWQTYSVQFIASGGTQTLRIAAEATPRPIRDSGLMIDDIALSETLPTASGDEDTAIRLPAIDAALLDTDGSETLAIVISGLPAGATLSDGSKRFTATGDAADEHHGEGSGRVDISGWNLEQLYFTPPPDAHGRFVLTVLATTTEQANQAHASRRAEQTVTVWPVNDAPLARDAHLTLPQGSRVDIDLAALVGDVDGDTLSWRLGAAAHGSVARNSEGTWTYVPQARFSGSDRFTFTVSDGTLTATASVYLTITPAKHPPQWQTTPPTSFDVHDGLPASVFTVAGTAGTATTLSFSWTIRRAAYANEIGVYRVDDADGRIGNRLPGDAGYAAAALADSRATLVFASDARPGEQAALVLPSGQYVAFYLVQDASRTQWQNHNAANAIGRGPLAFFSIQAANPDRSDHLRVRLQPDGSLTLAWEDLLFGGAGDFDDALIKGRGLTLASRPFVYRARAGDEDGDALTYRLLDAPAGARVDAASGVLAWAAPQAGSHTFRLEADDGHGGRVEQRFTVRFAPASGICQVASGAGAAAALAARQASDLRHIENKHGGQSAPPAKIDWSGAKPACFSGPVVSPSKWLAEFLGGHSKNRKPAELPSWQIRIDR